MRSTNSSSPRDFDAQTALLTWYAREQRDLPWRRDATPYRVLISEVMLQQTQVGRVIPYFDHFLERFPRVTDLAAAPRAAVIDAWAGLGYNRRAVYLHELAQAVCAHHAGLIPQDRKALLALPGIGPYTAGAILSMGFAKDEAAVDTNVERVLSRYWFGRELPAPEELRRLAERLVPEGRAGDWNQALMDLGATTCRARAPRCWLCPLRPGCQGAGAAVATPKRRQGRFLESTRYYRGRMVAALRWLGSDRTEPLYETGRRLAAMGVAEPTRGWETVAKDLAKDGLTELWDSAEGLMVGLPSARAVTY